MKYIAVIDPPITKLSKEILKALELHKKDPEKHPAPKLPKPKKRIRVGAYNTPFKAAIARNAELDRLGFTKAFYIPKKKLRTRTPTPEKAVPRDRGLMITLQKLKKNEQKESKRNTEKNDAS